MDSRSEQALKELATQVGEAAMDMEHEETAEFFDRLADWAYAQHEVCLIDPELEMQDYKEEQPTRLITIKFYHNDKKRKESDHHRRNEGSRR